MIEKLLENLGSHKNVIGIMLGGSRASGHIDEYSDYDVYVYLDQPIEEDIRRKLIEPFCKYMEYSNSFWELEDDGVLLNGHDVELIYRKIEDLESQISQVVVKHEAKCGYTTCFWENLMSSEIIYDPKNLLKILKKKYDVSYPKVLKENIILKNHALLKDKMPSYYYQIEKAIKRNDHISINHRLSELIASYYDILFAINEKRHPGEKKLVMLTKELNKLPLRYLEHITNLFQHVHHDHIQFLQALDDLLNNLNHLILNEGFEVTFGSYLEQM